MCTSSLDDNSLIKIFDYIKTNEKHLLEYTKIEEKVKALLKSIRTENDLTCLRKNIDDKLEDELVQCLVINIIQEEKIKEFLKEIESKIDIHWSNISKIEFSQGFICPSYPNNGILSLINMNEKAYKKAISEIQKDIRFMLKRRENLIRDNRISQGKIAGVISL